MFDPLALLVIVFIAMSIVSIVGVVLLYLSKSKKVKKGIFYFLAVWGMIIAYCNVSSIPIYMTGEIILAVGLGLLSVMAIVIHLFSKSEKKFGITKVLVTLSVVAGMVDCFLF